MKYKCLVVDHDDTIVNSTATIHFPSFELYMKENLLNPAVIVDCNHSNSGKKYEQQVRIANEVLHSMRHSSEIGNFVKGLMIESYIEPGSQKVEEHVYGKSITDPCLGWDESEQLIYNIAEQL